MPGKIVLTLSTNNTYDIYTSVEKVYDHNAKRGEHEEKRYLLQDEHAGRGYVSSLTAIKYRLSALDPHHPSAVYAPGDPNGEHTIIMPAHIVSVTSVDVTT